MLRPPCAALLWVWVVFRLHPALSVACVTSLAALMFLP